MFDEENGESAASTSAGSEAGPPRGPSRDLNGDGESPWLDLLPFWGVHLVALVGLWHLGWSWSGLVLLLASYGVRMFGVTAGLHRYFSHRSFATGRGFQLVLALLATVSVQKGVLWWAAHHRHHHRFSDQPEDVHSPRQRGFFWSHMGWILCRRHDVLHWDRVRDLAKYPELVWLQRNELTVVFLFAVLYAAFGGLHALIWGFFALTVVLWHSTFAINSLCHIVGRRRYDTGDDSRNSFLLALLTMGEGWHNNHHHYPRSAAQSFFWWEIDITYYLLCGLQRIRVVRGVGRPPRHVRNSKRLAAPRATDGPRLRPGVA